MQSSPLVRTSVALSILLALSGVSLTAQPSLPAAAAEGDNIAIDSGSLTWGVRASWRTYISPEHMDVSGGASKDSTGLITYPVQAGSYDPETGATDIRFNGAVRYWAHCGDVYAFPECALDLTMSEFRLVIDASEQTLYSHVTSRPLPGGSGGASTAPAIIDYGVIPVAYLDTSEAVVDTEDGVTSWSAVRATMTAAASPPFAGYYPAGAVLDQVAVSYEGDGGKPVVDESFTPPGTIRMTITDRWQHNATPPSYGTGQGLFYDATNDLLHLVVQASGTNPRIQALDAATLDPVATRAVVGAAPLAFDPSAGQVIVVEGGQILALTANRATGTYDSELVGAPAEQINVITWDPVGGQVLAIVGSTSAKSLIEFRRSEGGWVTGERYTLPAPPTGAGNLNQYWSQRVQSFRVASDGSVLIGRTSTPHFSHLTLGAGGSVTDTPYPHADAGLADSRFVLPGPDGVVWVSDGKDAVRYFIESDGSLTRTASPVHLSDQTLGDLALDPEDGSLWGKYPSTSLLVGASTDGVLVSGSFDTFGTYAQVAVGQNHAVFSAFRPSTVGTVGVARLDRSVSPTITQLPADAVVAADGNEPAPTSFTAAASGSPAPSVQWQSKLPGALAFTDIPDATSPTLEVRVTPGDNSKQYRAVFANIAGTIATDPVTLTVHTPPSVVQQPISVAAVVGGTAQFLVMPAGSPEPDVTWQRFDGGAWLDIGTGGQFTADGGYLTIVDVEAAQDGTRFRAKLTNSVGTITSDEVTLTVIGALDKDITYTGVAFEWTGSPEWQHQPPNASTANYFSAGVSDGTEATYAASADGVEIVQRDGSGGDAAASWATRGLHIDRGGSAAQLVRFTDGTAEVRADGSATISWPGAFSVNFYDGLVPFTMSNLVLEVSASGTGVLTADLAGYAGDMADPDKPKEAVPPVNDVTVATFSGVVVDAEHGFVVTPDYGGVQISVPSGVTAQDRSASGWGSWPQAFVDFQQTTGLAGYFYTTGGIFDANKKPNAFAVGFEGAVPEVPSTPEPEPTPTTPPAPPPAVKATEAGYLAWGVRGSFRDYITGPIAKGSINLSGGASSAGGAFRFFQTSADWNPDAGTGNAGYGGAVRFTGHSGVLDVTLSNPSIVVNSASSATLYVNANGGRIPIGNVNLAAATRSDVTGGVAYSGAPVTLTASGSSVFSYGSSVFYPAGTGMDSVTFVIGANSSGGGGGTVASFQKDGDWTPPATPPATEGIEGDPDDLANVHAGQELTVWADGFQPNEEDIKVVIYSEPLVLEQNLIADSTGKATWTGIIPSELEPGKHTLTFQGSVNKGIVLDVKAPVQLEGCTVQDATLTWGFKESFRAYISGSIAHGDWAVSDGATYETPSFGWPNGTGVYDTETGVGQVDFTGSIRFTGHDGLLDTTVANPKLQFIDENTAYLLLDVTGVTMEDALAGNTDNPVVVTAVPFVKLDLSGGVVTLSEDGTTLTGADVPTQITEQGYAAFPNYEPPTAFDPVSFTVSVSKDCIVAAPVLDGPADATPEPAGADLAWVAWTGGGVLAAALIAAAILLILRRRRLALAEDGAGLE